MRKRRTQAVTPAWVVEFHEDTDVGCPVQYFLAALGRSRRAKIVAVIGLLAERGPTLPFAEGRMKRYLEQRENG